MLSEIGEVTVALWPCRKSHRIDVSKKVVKFTDISEGGLPEKALKGQSIS